MADSTKRWNAVSKSAKLPLLLTIIFATSSLLNLYAAPVAKSPGGNSQAEATLKASWKPCPNACLKLSNHGWCYQNMPGKPDYLIWMNFPYSGGGGECWSLDHLGELIQYDGGRPVDNGDCPTCHRRLYIGDPTKSFKNKGPIPVHSRTIKKENETVLGRPWVKLVVQAGAADVLSFYLKELPASGWAIVDSTRVSQDSFIVITDGTKSKWMKIGPGEVVNYTEIILMDRF